MFQEMFATYNKVTPPSIDMEFFTEEPEDYTEYNPIAKTYAQQITTEVEHKPTSPSTVYPTKKKTTTKKVSVKKVEDTKKSTLKGTAEFENAFAQAVAQDPSIAKYKDFLTKTAKRESGFDSHIQNKSGKPYYGYFQFGHAALKQTSTLSMEQFRNNPVEQIKAAAKLYEQFISQSKSLGIYEKAKQQGYSDDAIAAGAWLGGVGGLKRYINGQGNPSDGADSVGKRMKDFNV